MDTSGNKGEWSEVYALFKLLADGELCTGDADMNKIEGLIYPIITIFRDNIFYNRDNHNSNIILKTSDGTTISTIPIIQFQKNAELLLTKIQKGKNAFQIPEITEFRKETYVENIKAPSSDKADIVIIVHDERAGFDPKLSFSIKSQLGSPSSLLNAGKNTNFIYRLSKDFDQTTINEINGTDSQQKRMDLINKYGAKLHFVGIQPSSNNKKMFECNLTNIDTSLPLILSYMIFYYYQASATSGIKELCAILNKQNPLGFDQSYQHTYYETKIKRFLVDTALGMKPASLWNGRYEANGGYLVVKEDGDIVCYHIYNKNEFEDYLFHNTKMESASRSRHDYGYVYCQDGHLFIKLNLQIRFKK